ncbi:MAG TPA: hypothetical protein PK869_16110 [Candidatus Hydrogenedentes bacterium]|nr:hypothetical protein [Candidatus Hydrogenedentota bacterium]
MRIIVSDSCALIDLKKGRLLDVFVQLPYELVVPDMVLADELLSFSKAETALMRRCMTVVHLDGNQVLRMHREQHANPALTHYDCAAVVIAEANPDAILLTGDRRLRAVAVSAGIECHGVLWVVEELDKAKLTTKARLLSAMELWRADLLVRLPREELERLIARFKRK